MQKEIDSFERVINVCVQETVGAHFQRFGNLIIQQRKMILQELLLGFGIRQSEQLLDQILMGHRPSFSVN
jgi:hypothetical protein